MNEHFQSSIPNGQAPTTQLNMLKAALAAAEKHLNGVINPTNETAIKRQNEIIKQYKRQIADLERDSWLTI